MILSNKQLTVVKEQLHKINLFDAAIETLSEDEEEWGTEAIEELRLHEKISICIGEIRDTIDPIGGLS